MAMKKYISIFLILLLALFTVACNINVNDTDTERSTDTEADDILTDTNTDTSTDTQIDDTSTDTNTDTEISQPNEDKTDNKPVYSKVKKEKLSPCDELISWGEKVKINNSFLKSNYDVDNSVQELPEKIESAELLFTSDGYFTDSLTSAHFSVYKSTDKLKNSYIVYGFEDAEYVLQITSVVDILADEEISRLLNHIEGSYELAKTNDGATRIYINGFSNFNSIQIAILNRLAYMEGVSKVNVGYISEHQYRVPENTTGYEYECYDVSFGIWFIVDTYSELSRHIYDSPCYTEITEKYNESFFRDNIIFATGISGGLCKKHTHFLDANYISKSTSRYPYFFITRLEDNCDCERINETALVTIPRADLDDAVTFSGATNININILKRYSNYHISSEEYGKDPYEAIKHKVKIEAENVYLAEDKGIKYIDYGYNDAIYTVKIKFTTPKGKELAYEALDKLGVGFGGKVDDSLDSMIIIYYSCFETFKNAQKILYSRFAPVWYVDEIIVDCLDFYEEPLLKTYDTKTLRLVALPTPTPQANMYLSSLEEYNEFMEIYDIERLIDTKYMSLIYSDEVEFNETLFQDNFVFVFLREYEGRYEYQRHYYTNFTVNKVTRTDIIYGDVNDGEDYIVDGFYKPSVSIEDMYISRIKGSGVVGFGDWNDKETVYYLDFVVVPKSVLSEYVEKAEISEEYTISVLDTAKSFIN